MKTLKRIYYSAMYELTDSIMWLSVGNDPEQFAYWWRVSSNYRTKRDRTV